MFVPISSLTNNSISPGGRLTPVARGSAVAFRPAASPRDADTIVHLSEQAQALLAGRGPIDVTAREEITVIPVPADDAASRDGEFEPIFGAAEDVGEGDEANSAASDSHSSVSAHLPGQKARTPEEERAVQQLRARDVEVRAHEAAHAAAAGSLGGRPSLEYVVGPDGRRYAVAGEVSVDTSPGRTPEETIVKARTIRAAATAPASPSAQDMAVAAAAARMESDARNAIRERHAIESRAKAERSESTEEQEGVRRVDWAKVGSAAGADAKATSAIVSEIAATATRAASPSVVSALPDAEMMMLQLVREQVAMRGGMGHTHLASGCGFCRRAAATYA